MENQVFESANLFETAKQSFVTVGGISKNCLKLLAVEKEKQDIVIGDARGIIYSTNYVVDEPKIIIKTDPYPKEVTDVEIDQEQSRIFFSVGNSIYSIDKNNKNKWKVEFNIASDIEMFKIKGEQIWAIANNFLSKFRFGEVTNSVFTYDNKTKISSIYITNIYIDLNLVLLIGSEDDKIKVVKEPGEIVHIITTNGGPSSFCKAKLDFSDTSENFFYYGTYMGSIGCIKIKDENEMELLSELKYQKEQFEVVDIKVADVNYDAKNELISIRANGFVDVYSIIDEYQNINLICKFQTHENLTGLQIGRYKDKEHIEIILSSLSGLVFSLTPDISSIKKIKSIDAKKLKKNIESTKLSIETLTNKLNNKKIEFEKNSKSADLLVKNSYKMNYKFTLLYKRGLFQLIVDSEFPMEMAILYCPKTKLDIIEIKTKEVNMNIIDEKNLDEETLKHCKFMTTFSMKDAIHHLELLVRTYEGENDEINIGIIPYNKPKTAQFIKIPVYALSFHKIYEPDYEKDVGNVIGCDDDIANTLIIENIRASEMNQILHLIIPNIPEQIEEDKANYILRSTFMNTLVEINIEKDKCEIKSPFISTLMTLKKQINKEAERRRRKITSPIKFKKASVWKILEILDPKIKEIFELEKKYKLVMAFKELGDSISNQELPEEYLVIKNKGDEILGDYKNRALNLNYYKQLIEQLFLDIKEVNYVDSNKIDEIKMLMEDYSYEKLKKIFSFLN